MQYTEIIAVCSQIHTKHTNTLRRQNVGFYIVKAEGSHINYPHSVPKLTRVF